MKFHFFNFLKFLCILIYNSFLISEVSNQFIFIYICLSERKKEFCSKKMVFQEPGNIRSLVKYCNIVLTL